MATTQTTYTGNGSTTNYSFTFEYLKQADVKVTLNTVATTAFTFANATTLAFTTAPASGVDIRIFRDTAIDNLSATFFPGSAIKAEDLNENFTQNLYVTQESHFEVDTANTTADTAKTTADTALTNATTAISTANSATTTANTAITTSNSATTTANAATTTANTASTNASSAVTTANTASTNATAAVNTANTASTNASAAVTTANSAQADATTAISTANSATTTANSATTTANSALTSANTANTNATAAQSAATTAQASATAAQTSATAAQTSATAAQAQATLAADVRNAFTVTDSNSDGTFDFVVGDIPIKGNAGVKLPFESVTYAEEGAIRYNNSLDKIELYNGAGQWVTAGGGASVSSTPPTLPSAGDVWYDHDNGRAYVYYNDGDSNQWVEMNPSWNGYVADNSVTSAKIVDGSIVNADVNSSAAISQSKLNLDITNSEINASAAIALSKLSTGALPSAITVASSNIVDGTIVNADVNASAAISQSKLALDITNSEVNASAAIAGTKISPDFGSQNVITTGKIEVGTVIDLNANGSATFGGQVTSTNASYGFTSNATSFPFTAESSLGNGGKAFYAKHTGSSSSSRYLFYGENNAGEVFNVAANGTASFAGNVGINNSSPSSYNSDGRNLVVGSGSGGQGLTIASGTSGYGNIYFADGTSGDALYSGMLSYYHADNHMQFRTASTERMRIDSSGRLLVGTSSTSNAATAVFQGNSSGSTGPAFIYLRRGSTPASTGTLGVIEYSDNSGNIGAEVFANRDGGSWTSGSSHPTYLGFSTTADGASSPTERMRITNGGIVCVNRTSVVHGGQLSLDYTNGTTAGLAIKDTQTSGTGAVLQVVNGSGTIVGSITQNQSTTSFNTSSDYRLKKNVVDITDGIARVKQLQPRRFNFIANDTTTVDGFVAHEAQAVVPEAVTGEKDGEEMQGIDQSKLVPLLTAALQEAITKIETLETQNASLEARLTALEGGAS